MLGVESVVAQFDMAPATLAFENSGITVATVRDPFPRLPERYRLDVVC